MTVVLEAPQPEDAEQSGAQLARMLLSPLPHDLDENDLARYKGITPPLASWDYIAGRCADASGVLFDIVLSETSKGDYAG